MDIKLFAVLLATSSTAMASTCPHEDKIGMELLKRVYAAEMYRHGPIGKQYTEDLKELSYDLTGLENNCDIKNWDILIKVNGKEKFQAVIKSKITNKSFTVDQDKNVTKK